MNTRAPSYNQLPAASSRRTRGGPEVLEISLQLEVVTPILGGSPTIREIDEVDIIRVPTVRGHLRFWWRALYAAKYPSALELYAHESALWGRAAGDEGGRSAVEICIDVEKRGMVDASEIRLSDSKDGKATSGAYALRFAREDKKKNWPPMPRRAPGTKFLLTIIAPGNYEMEVKNALRAWILFGGYGSRTRRGLGSLTVLDKSGSWLPSRPTREALECLFGFDVFAAPKAALPCDTPWLAGAALHVNNAQDDAMKAWTTALDWLKEFRQGTSGPKGQRAREPGTGKPQPLRPSISNWPEADKIRRLKGKTSAHQPRHNSTPAWPRAGFGLPIIGQFQKKARNGGQYDEPDDFELRWRSENTEHDRLASPLIVKALPLVEGRFVPCALWLNRAYPAGKVVLRGVKNSSAPFDLLVAPGDTAQFSALYNKNSLRAAFLEWLHSTYQTSVVAP